MFPEKRSIVPKTTIKIYQIHCRNYILTYEHMVECPSMLLLVRWQPVSTMSVPRQQKKLQLIRISIVHTLIIIDLGNVLCLS